MLIPEENEKDLAEIPKNIKDKLKIVPVKWIDQVLEHALVHMPRSGDCQRRARKRSPRRPPTSKNRDDIVRAH